MNVVDNLTELGMPPARAQQFVDPGQVAEDFTYEDPALVDLQREPGEAGDLVSSLTRKRDGGLQAELHVALIAHAAGAYGLKLVLDEDSPFQGSLGGEVVQQ